MRSSKLLARLRKRSAVGSATRSRQRGFTLIEVMTAISVFTVGVLALSGSAAIVTRMIGGGTRSTHASFVAAQGIERLRASTMGPAGCAALHSGVDTTGPYVRSWTVTSASGVSRIVLVVRYAAQPRYVRADTFSTSVGC